MNNLDGNTNLDNFFGESPTASVYFVTVFQIIICSAFNNKINGFLNQDDLTFIILRRIIKFLAFVFIIHATYLVKLGVFKHSSSLPRCGGI